MKRILPEVDIVIGLQHGDEGKAAVVYELSRKNKYTHCVRFSGSSNAGHTFYHNNQKIIAHQIPVGIVNGLISMIGPNCVLNISKFQKELDDLNKIYKVDTTNKIKVAYNTHIVTDKHVVEDCATDRIGSTKQGVSPAYRDKMLKIGSRAEDCPVLKEYLCDSFEELNKPENVVLMEGAQGHELDIDWGDYPYVTSSSCGVSGALTTGIPWISISEVYGVAKPYDTYVGNKNHQTDDTSLVKLQALGSEVGATTGRKRQCNWLNLDKLIKAIKINFVTNLIFKKCDVINSLNEYKIYHKNELISFSSFNEMKSFIEARLPAHASITYSSTPYGI